MFPAMALLLLPALAQAHVGVGESAGFVQGLGHPSGGADHVLAMIAVGLWAAQRGGRALWMIPCAFVVVMALSGLAGAVGVDVPFVAQGIVLSVLVLGLLVCAAVRLPVPVSILIVGLFAVFHGHAHGAEMPADAWGLAYGAGFVLTTALLHGLGIGVALFTATVSRIGVARLAGAAIAACGAILLLTA